MKWAKQPLSWALSHPVYYPPIYSSLVSPPEPQLFRLPNPQLLRLRNRNRCSVNQLRSDILHQNLTHNNQMSYSGCVNFLWWLRQSTANAVAYNNTRFSSCGSGVRNPECLSLGWNQGVGRLCFLWGSRGDFSLPSPTLRLAFLAFLGSRPLPPSSRAAA